MHCQCVCMLLVGTFSSLVTKKQCRLGFEDKVVKGLVCP